MTSSNCYQDGITGLAYQLASSRQKRTLKGIKRKQILALPAKFRERKRALKSNTLVIIAIFQRLYELQLWLTILVIKWFDEMKSGWTSVLTRSSSGSDKYKQACMHVSPPFFTYICIRPAKRARKHTTRKPNRSAPTLEISSVHLPNYADTNSEMKLHTVTKIWSLRALKLRTINRRWFIWVKHSYRTSP